MLALLTSQQNLADEVFRHYEFEARAIVTNPALSRDERADQLDDATNAALDKAQKLTALIRWMCCQRIRNFYNSVNERR